MEDAAVGDVAVEDTAGGWWELRARGLDGESAEAVHEVFQKILPADRTVFEEHGPQDAERGRPQARPDRFVVRGFVEDDETGREARRRLEEAYYFLGRIRELPALEVELLPDVDWNEEWRKLHVSLPVGERLWIVPGRGEPAPPGRVSLRLEPGSAFGLGTHPTTRLALELLEGEVREGAHVADVGCGSGVLGLAALLLGASGVEACDVDVAAVRATEAAAADNGLSGRVLVREGSVDTLEGPFDLVLLNIVASVSSRLAPAAVGRLAPGGSLVLSGMLEHNQDAVRRVLELLPGTVTRQASEADWRALVFCRDPTSAECPA